MEPITADHLPPDCSDLHLLQRIRRLLLAGWCRGYATDRADEPRYCLLGAVEAVVFPTDASRRLSSSGYAERWTIRQRLATHLAREILERPDAPTVEIPRVSFWLEVVLRRIIPAWNDAASRTQDEILAVVDAAIVRLSGERLLAGSGFRVEELWATLKETELPQELVTVLASREATDLVASG